MLTMRQVARLLIILSSFLISATLRGAETKPSVTPVPGKLALPGMENFEVEGHAAFIFMPSEDKRARRQPWIFYAPTLPAYPDEAERWMHEQFLAAGVAVAGDPEIPG